MVVMCLFNSPALPGNRADLARFLSEKLIASALPDPEIVMAGGFLDEHEVRSSKESQNVSLFVSTHEEADTKLVLHTVQR